MIINNEKKYHPDLVKAAVKYCESIGANYIHDIAVLDDTEYRIMYHNETLEQNKNRKMQAIILPLPPNP